MNTRRLGMVAMGALLWTQACGDSGGDATGATADAAKGGTPAPDNDATPSGGAGGASSGGAGGTGGQAQGGAGGTGGTGGQPQGGSGGTGGQAHGGSGGRGGQPQGGTGGQPQGGSGGTGGTGGQAPPIDPTCHELCVSHGDGQCDDGGPGAAFAVCPLGSDCQDCGPRDGSGGAGGGGGAGGAPAPEVPCAGVRCRPRVVCRSGSVVEEAGACDPVLGACVYEEVGVQDCGERACVEGQCVDLCADGPGCPRLADACEGDLAVRYAASGRCEPRTGACDYDRVRAETRCVAGEICDAGRCVPHCATAGCPPRAPTCEGYVQVVDRRDGLCDAATGTCDYAGVTRRIDCDALGLLCEDAECVENVPIQPRPGDLVITEIMLEPAAAGPETGHWVELYNASPRLLVLEASQLVTSAGSFPLRFEDGENLLIGPGQYRVLGGSADAAVNGGIEGMLRVPGFAFARRDDFVRLDVEAYLVNDFGLGDRWTVDEVRVLPAAFGAEPGASVQWDVALGFGAENGNPGGWCPADEPFGAGDRGSPGGPNHRCHFEVTEHTLPALRDRTIPGRPAFGARVRVRDSVISATNGLNLLWIQTPRPDLYSAINLFVSGQDISALRVGDLVDVEGVFNDYFGKDQIIATRLDVVGIGRPPLPVVVPLEALTDRDAAEPYESLLLRVEHLSVTLENPDAPSDFGEFQVNDTLRVDDTLYRLSRPIEVGTTFDALSGVLDYTFRNFKLQPRGPEDVVGRFGPGPRPMEVELRDFDFSPESAELALGDAVRFTNFDRAAHTVTSGRRGAPDAGVLFDSGLLRTGESFDLLPAEAGRFPYFCRAHPHEDDAPQVLVRAPCPQACDAYVSCLSAGQALPCRAARGAGGEDFFRGACRITCVPPDEMALSCEVPTDAVTVAACGRTLCGQIVTRPVMEDCLPPLFPLITNTVGMCNDLRPEFFECLGRVSRGAVEFASICNAARACEDEARLF